MQLETTLPADTATADAQTIAPETPMFTPPQGLLDQGFEALPIHPLWGLGDDIRYVYKPLRAWDDAQKMADRAIELTGGRINLLAHELMLAMRECAAIQPQDGETEDELYLLRGQVWQKLATEAWTRFLESVPRFKPYEFAKEAIERCGVRRVPASGEDSKPGNDASRDPGGLIFQATGGGAVERYYKGRRHHILRIGLCAFWGSCGDFFGVA